MKPPSIPTREQYIVTGETTRVKGVLTDFPKPILPKIGGEHTRDGLVKLPWETPNTKRSELKSYDKIKRCFENKPLWTEL